MAEVPDNSTKCIKDLDRDKRVQLGGVELLKYCQKCKPSFHTPDKELSVPQKMEYYFDNHCWERAAEQHLLIRTSGTIQHLFKEHMMENRPDSKTRQNIVLSAENYFLRKFEDNKEQYIDWDNSLIDRDDLVFWYMYYYNLKIDGEKKVIAIKQLEFCVTLFVKEHGEKNGLLMNSDTEFFKRAYGDYKQRSGNGSRKVSWAFISDHITDEDRMNSNFYLSQSEKVKPESHKFLHKDGLEKFEDEEFENYKLGIKQKNEREQDKLKCEEKTEEKQQENFSLITK